MFNNNCSAANSISNNCTLFLSGMVTNGIAPIANKTILYTVNDASFSTTTDSSGNYAISVPKGRRVTISASPSAEIASVPLSYRFTQVCNAMMGLDFTLIMAAATPAANTFTVSGAVSGLPNNSAIFVTYVINGQNFTATTDAFGNYSFTAPANANIIIIPPVRDTFTISPTDIQINNLSANSSGNNFVYTRVTFVVSGTVTGFLPSNAGVPISFSINGQAPLIVNTDAAGNYSFAAPEESNITITPAAPVPPIDAVVPTSYQVSNLKSNVTGRDFQYLQFQP